MSSKPNQAVTKPSPRSRQFGPSKSKNPSHDMTSHAIADDIAAFKRGGGRIEILGHTPLRSRAQATAFRSDSNERKAPTAVPGNVVAQD